MPMFGKQIAALGLSSLLLFSGAVTAANAEETTPIDTAGYMAAVEALAESGVVSGSATALQTGDGLRLAEEAGLLDGDTLSLTQLSAQALVQETEALRKENFLKENTKHTGKLYQQNSRHTVAKLCVTCLVAPYLHAQPCARTPADGSQQQQRRFTDTPFRFLCLVLIHTIDHKSDGIHRRHINNQQF